MKRRDLLRHLSQHGCRFVREGGEHSIVQGERQQGVSGQILHSNIEEQRVHALQA